MRPSHASTVADPIKGAPKFKTQPSRVTDRSGLDGYCIRDRLIPEISPGSGTKACHGEEVDTQEEQRELKRAN